MNIRVPEPRSWQLRPWMRIAIAAAALCVLVLIAYAGSLSNGFVWDDNQQIVMNPDLRPGAAWSHLFSAEFGVTSIAISPGIRIITGRYK